MSFTGKIKISVLMIFLVSVFVFGQNRYTQPVTSAGASPTAPVTNFKRGTIASPDESRFRQGNLVVTGNVGGGRHFRGVVPYGSQYEFRDGQALSSLNSFYRRSASNPYSFRTSSLTRPYVLPSNTVTTTSYRNVPAGFSELNYLQGSAPANMGPVNTTSLGNYGISDYTQYGREAGLPPLSGQELSVYQGDYTTSTRPLSLTTKQLSRHLNQQLRVNEQKELLDEIKKVETRLSQQSQEIMRRARIEQPGREYLDKLKDENIEKRKDKPSYLNDEQYIYEPSRPERLIEDRSIEPEKPLREKVEDKAPADELKNMTDELFDELNKAERVTEKRQPEGTEDKKADQADKSEEQGKELSGSKPQEQVYKEPIPSSPKVDSPLRFEDLTPDQRSRAKEILGSHKSFESLAKEKFSLYMKAGENFMSKGKYYKAADSYTLASVYNPGSVKAVISRSHSLFAAGEYMSSAFFLIRALKQDPEFVTKQVDIIEIIGDRDHYDHRINDIREWFDRSNSPELSLLMAYVFYNSNRASEASEAIDFAIEKMQDAEFIMPLKKAIDNVQF